MDCDYVSCDWGTLWISAMQMLVPPCNCIFSLWLNNNPLFWNAFFIYSLAVGHILFCDGYWFYEGIYTNCENTCFYSSWVFLGLGLMGHLTTLYLIWRTERLFSAGLATVNIAIGNVLKLWFSYTLANIIFHFKKLYAFQWVWSTTSF